MKQQITAVCLLLLFWGLAVQTALANSPVVDEPMHLLRAITLRQTGDLRFQIGHAPLSHRLMGLLLPTEPTVPEVTSLPGWAENDRHLLAESILWAGLPPMNIWRTFFLARFTIICVALLVGCITVVFARRRNGWGAALLVLAFFALSPNLLASATIGTTDLVSVLGFVLTSWALWEFSRARGWCWLVLAGAGVGVALGAKLTGALVVPLALVMLVFGGREERGLEAAAAEGGLRPFFCWLALGPTAFVVFWAIYGFEFRPPTGFTFPVPAATYWDNFLRVSDHIGSGHQTFLLGERSKEGWYHYFLVAFGVKTALPVLLLLAGSVGWLAWGRRWRATIYLWLLPLSLLAVASLARLNIGYRHILPMLPFVWLLIVEAAWGLKVEMRGLGGKGWKLWLQDGVVGIAFVWLTIGMLRVHPHHLSHFNELVGLENGLTALSDSNLDWGQDFYELTAFVEAADFPVQVGYLGVMQPALGEGAWRIDEQTEMLPDFAPANPEGGWYALSASFLQGMHVAEPDLFDGLRRVRPNDRLGYSILLYELPPAAEGGFVGHCAAPAPLLTPEQGEALVGQSGLRHFIFDCGTSWVFPENGRSGWYLLPLGWNVSWINERVDGKLTQAYRHNSTERQPAYDVYYWKGANVVEMLGEGEAVTFGETAVLLDYWQAGNGWTTVWQATQAAPPQLSVQAHLAVAADAPPLVADGLGFSSEQWRVGDLIIQRHLFDQPGTFLQTGLYNFVTGERIEPTPLQLPR